MERSNVDVVVFSTAPAPAFELYEMTPEPNSGGGLPPHPTELPLLFIAMKPPVLLEYITITLEPAAVTLLGAELLLPHPTIMPSPFKAAAA